MTTPLVLTQSTLDSGWTKSSPEPVFGLTSPKDSDLMSSDNYMLVREHEGKYVVTMEFASAYEPGPIAQAYARGTWFDTLAEAYDYAFGEYTEYGVESWVGQSGVVADHRQKDLALYDGLIEAAETIADARQVITDIAYHANRAVEDGDYQGAIQQIRSIL